jgi:hypothetical protein
MRYHDKAKIVTNTAKEDSVPKVRDHPFFGMNRNLEKTVLQELDTLRKFQHHR